MRFPLIGSAVLFSLFLVFKFLPKVTRSQYVSPPLTAHYHVLQGTTSEAKIPQIEAVLTHDLVPGCKNIRRIMPSVCRCRNWCILCCRKPLVILSKGDALGGILLGTWLIHSTD